MKRRLALGLFLCLALAQLAVPASDDRARRELTLQYGRQYRFQTAPVDPSDPFRGALRSLTPACQHGSDSAWHSAHAGPAGVCHPDRGCGRICRHCLIVSGAPWG
jgi:hypothetical protein